MMDVERKDDRVDWHDDPCYRDYREARAADQRAMFRFLTVRITKNDTRAPRHER